jgi:AcrR family transcriptional regulator
MTPTQRKLLDQEGIKQHRKNEVILAALEVFSARGIENTTMVDVANAAHVGVASLYRYYHTKFDLALESATVLWIDQINPCFMAVIDESYPKQSGLDQVMRLLKVTPRLVTELPEALRFLEYFDNFIVSQSIDHTRLKGYGEVFGPAKSVFMEAMIKGQKDGSIREDLDQEAFYLTITHTLMSLSQKLILRGNVVDSDESVGKLQQIDLVIDMAKTYIKHPMR